MLARLRFTTGGSVAIAYDAVRALLETGTTSIPTLYDALDVASKPVFDQANSYINVSKKAIGWTLDHTVGTGPTRSIIIKSLCANSAKYKYAMLSCPSSAYLVTGTTRSGDTLTDIMSAAYGTWGTTTTMSGSYPFDVYVSASDRHIMIHSVRIDTASNVSCAVFEFVNNDGYFTETSPYIPVVQAAYLDSSGSGFSSTVASRSLRAPRIKNMRSAGYPDVLGQTGGNTLLWETPFSEDEYIPADNAGYDYIGNSTDRTPILVPFGVCSKITHGFSGGAISDLTDIYMGPTSVGGNYDDVEVAGDIYVTLPFRSNSSRFFVPKG